MSRDLERPAGAKRPRCVDLSREINFFINIILNLPHYIRACFYSYALPIDSALREIRGISNNNSTGSFSTLLSNSTCYVEQYHNSTIQLMARNYNNNSNIYYIMNDP